MSTPLITLGMTCYNSAGSVARALESALAQDWPNVEIIAVDDRSKDGTWDILKTYEARGVRIHRHVANKGCAGARNTIIELARGEFIAFCDDDDESLSGRLTRQWHRLTEYEKASGASIVFCNGGREVHSGGRVHFAPAMGASGRAPQGPNVARYFLGVPVRAAWKAAPFGGGVVMGRTDVFREFGGFDDRLGRFEDWDLWIRSAQKGAHFVAVDGPVMRQHKTTSAYKTRVIALAERLKLRRKHVAFLRSENFLMASYFTALGNGYGNAGQLWKARAALAVSAICAPARYAQHGELSLFAHAPPRV